jgi:RsiW-degrading membrane proteinase PrsW (M82 family)
MSALLITLAVAWVYLTLVRFVDVNEREPVWAIAVVFCLGVLGACLADLVLGSPLLNVPVWQGALAVEATKLLSLGAGIVVLQGVARIRGWSEFSDVLDGLVYGITVGLGYSAGETLLRELHTARFAAAHLLETPWQTLLRAAAGGLSHGVFGGMVGLGWAGALEARSRAGRLASPVLGLGMAVVLNALFRILAHGNALGGQAGVVRAWLAVLLPFAAFVAIWLVALLAERRAIHAHLSTSSESGLVSAADLKALESFWRRQLRYAGLLLRGKLAGALRLAARHNRQVQLALLLRRIGREPDADRRHRFEHQADRIRATLRHASPVALLLLVVLGAACSRPEPQPDLPSGESVAPAPSPPPSAEPAPIPVPLPAPVLPPGLLSGTPIPLDSLLTPPRRDLDAYWQRQIGAAYRSPVSVGPYSAFSTECPKQTRNARWCAAERRIYYDPDWLDSFRGEAGEFAPVFVLAHEWGHLVQDVRGELDPGSAKWTLQLELQADCLAGQWTGDAIKRQVVKRGEEDHAILALRRMRDPVDYPWFKADAHGDAGQRINAFLEGHDGRDCDGEPFWKRVHLDPQASQQDSTPASGPLLSTLACRIGRFDRVEVHPWPEVLSTVITDAIQATFRASDGTTIVHFAVVLVNAPAAERHFEGFEQLAIERGYRTTKEGPVLDRASGTQIGAWKLLEGLTTMLLLRNRQRVQVHEGPKDAVWEFSGAPVSFDCP